MNLNKLEYYMDVQIARLGTTTKCRKNSTTDGITNPAGWFLFGCVCVCEFVPLSERNTRNTRNERTCGMVRGST